MPLLGGNPGLIASSFDQVIRKDPASRGTETSAEVLVGPPGDDAGGWNRTLVHSKHGAGTGKKELLGAATLATGKERTGHTGVNA